MEKSPVPLEDGWRIASFCDSAACIEANPNIGGIRDSENPNSPVLCVGAVAFAQFVEEVKQDIFPLSAV